MINMTIPTPNNNLNPNTPAQSQSSPPPQSQSQSIFDQKKFPNKTNGYKKTTPKKIKLFIDDYSASAITIGDCLNKHKLELNTFYRLKERYEEIDLYWRRANKQKARCFAQKVQESVCELPKEDELYQDDKWSEEKREDGTIVRRRILTSPGQRLMESRAKAYQWLAARSDPETYGDKQCIEQTTRAVIAHHHTIDSNAMDLQQFTQMISNI